MVFTMSVCIPGERLCPSLTSNTPLCAIMGIPITGKGCSAHSSKEESRSAFPPTPVPVPPNV